MARVDKVFILSNKIQALCARCERGEHMTMKIIDLAREMGDEIEAFHFENEPDALTALRGEELWAQRLGRREDS